MKNSLLNRLARAFTLVELLVVIAIIAILVAVAVPAYNNYSTKSKFTEVVLATAPIKTFVSTCAIDGDCSSGNTIALPAVGGSSSGGAASAALAPSMSVFVNTILAGCSGTFTQTQKDSFIASWSGSYTVSVDPNHNNNYCMIQNGGSTCTGICAASASFVANPNGSVIGPNVASYYAAGFGSSYVATQGGAGISVPCVGASSSGCQPSTKYVQTASSNLSGVITATAVTSSGLNGETVVLTPQLSGGRVDWALSGTCKTRAGGALC